MIDERWEHRLPDPASPSALPSGIDSRYPQPQRGVDDAAFAPPYDPLTRGSLSKRARVISRDPPIVHVETGWTPESLRVATVEHIHGLFHLSTQVMDTLVLTDSRVQSALEARSGGLLGRQLTFGLPKKFRGSALAREALDVWRAHWPAMASEESLSELLTSRVLLGFGQAQATWQDAEYTLPTVSMWNSRYTYYDFTVRRYINITMDGPEVVDPGDGHHILYVPHGSYRGWMRGKAFAIINWWLSRQYALRDMSRYSERHGFPIITAISPMGADVDDVDCFRESLSNLGQESVVQLPQSADPSIGKYALEYLEAEAANYEVFGQLIDHCNAEITLAIMGQNLAGGSEVKEGSFAAARVHADVRQQILQRDAMSLSRCIYEQVSRPFAALNFGNADLAPMVMWNVDPVEDKSTRTKNFLDCALGINYARLSGLKFRNPRKIFASIAGVDVGDIEHIDPTQVEAKLAGATGTDPGEDGASSTSPTGTIGTKGAMP
jgi:hypothetical protein